MIINGPELLEETGPVSGRTVTTQHRQFLTISAQIKYLRELIDDWRGRAWTREKAVQIVFHIAGCKPKDKLCHALAIAEWVQKNITYVNELPETFQTPQRTVELTAGDCDDFTTLIGSLLEAVGIPVKVMGMKVGGRWVHVFPLAIVQRPGKAPLRLPLDATLNTPVRYGTNPVRLSLERGRKVEVLEL